MFEHLEVDPVPQGVDTCLGFTAVVMVEVFSELEKCDEEVGDPDHKIALDLADLPLLEPGVDQTGLSFGEVSW